MLDSFGRDINYLRLSVTDTCNYRCEYCMDSGTSNGSRHGDALSTREFINICDAAIECGIKKIRITGGEPLTRPGITDLCRGIRSLEGIEELAITTNGALLKEMAYELKTSGVDRINISLDTLNEEKYRKITATGELTEVLQGIDAAFKAGFSNIKVNVVLMGGINDDEIMDFVNLTVDNDISVRFIELMPIGPCVRWEDSRFISTDTVLKVVPKLVPIEKNGVARLYRLENSRGTVGLISPLSNRFCNECNRLRITADGRILPCLHSDIEYSIRNFSRQEIIDTICTAVNNKPRQHYINEKHISDNKDYMHNIGG